MKRWRTLVGSWAEESQWARIRICQPMVHALSPRSLRGCFADSAYIVCRKQRRHSSSLRPTLGMGHTIPSPLPPRSEKLPPPLPRPKGSPSLTRTTNAACQPTLAYSQTVRRKATTSSGSTPQRRRSAVHRRLCSRSSRTSGRTKRLSCLGILPRTSSVSDSTRPT